MKKDVKNTVQAHSAAKVEFYKTYLKRYIPILSLSNFINEINIFDIYCGAGIYDDNRKGSPIVAFDLIKELRITMGIQKPINLYVNDFNSKRVSRVVSYFEEHNPNEMYCKIYDFNLEANQMFEEVSKIIKSQPGNSRNLIFIDPYGYKEIKKESLYNLLENGKTEVILFLPISQMQRFTKFSMEVDATPYIPLKNFVNSFFLDEMHPIKSQTVTDLEYISYLMDALRYNGKFFSASYSIERSKSAKFSLFFMTSHIYGFEKILEVIWYLDDSEGRGFKLPPNTLSLFEVQDKKESQEKNFQKLENILLNYLHIPRNNKEIYELVLRNRFLPKFANEVFKKWQESHILNVHLFQENKSAPKNAFYVNWENFRNGVPKAILSIKKHEKQ